MILVDTSVWIDYFNGIDNPHTDALDAAISDGVAAIGDLILLEILQGFRRDQDYSQARRWLSTLDQYALFEHGMPIRCTDNYRKLRKLGCTVRKTADLIIATFCIDHKIPLLFLDRDFLPFARHLGLRPALLHT